MGDGQLGVVLVHGFNSGPKTWRHLQESIAQDESLGDVQVLPFVYATGIMRWNPLKKLQVFPQISTIADSLGEYLQTEGGAFRDLVMVTHSMGGLVVQRYLARMLADGRGRELARIRRVVMLACPNDGSEVLRSLRRKVLGRRGRNPQERELRPLNEQVAETRRVIVNQVLGATAVTDRTCPVPFYAYAGESDAVVTVASARSVFGNAAALPGDHFSILKATTPDHRTFTTLRRHLHEAGAARSGAPGGPAPSAAGAAVVRYRPVGVIPPRVGAYQNRAERGWLRQALTGGGTAVLGQADGTELPGEPERGPVLSGMGGVGKTQLAAEHARTALAGGEVDLLVWVTAADRASLVAGLGRAGVEVVGADRGDPQAAAEAFIAWLEPKASQEVCRWLVVLDDVSDPGDLHGLLPPASPHGRTLITTRRRDAAFTLNGHTRIDVGLFTETEAVSYLRTVLATHNRTEPAGELAALARDLGRLPLALSQAAAFMIDAVMPCGKYRTRLADRERTLADASPQPLPLEHTWAMAAAWDLSIQRADRMRPAGLARPLLQLAAFLDPNGIPATVLTSAPALAYLAGHRNHRDDRTEETGAVPAEADVTAGNPTAADVTDGLRVLHRLSLIDHTGDDSHREVRIHALIQRAVRDTLTPQQHQDTARTAADALTAAWPDLDTDTALTQILRVNTAALAARAEDALHQPDAHLVLYRAGHTLADSGQIAAAVRHFEQLTATTGRYLGPDHPDTLTARDSLASSRLQAGDTAGAKAEFTRLLDDYLRILGPDHPDTLTTRNNLASALGRAGDAEGAKAAYTELLRDRLRVLGPDDPATLTTRNNLAAWQGRTGDAIGAKAVYTELLRDRLRVLGPNHPDTLATRSNLAYWQGAAGDPAGAEVAFAELVPDVTRELGPDHPQTLAARHNLARWQGEAGDAAGAEAAFTELLQDMLRVLGPDHPHTLNARRNLDRWQNREDEATGTPG